MTEAAPPAIPPVPVAPTTEAPPSGVPTARPEPLGTVVELNRTSQRTILLAAAIIAGPLTLVSAAGFATLALQHAGLRQQQEVGGAAPVRNRVSNFLTDIQDRDWSAAHDQLCTVTKRNTGNSKFVEAVSARPLKGFRILRSDADAVRGLETASVDVEATWADANDPSAVTQEPTTMMLRLEGGQWRICTGPF